MQAIKRSMVESGVGKKLPRNGVRGGESSLKHDGPSLEPSYCSRF
jgi:hypothetical protein